MKRKHLLSVLSAILLGLGALAVGSQSKAQLSTPPIEEIVINGAGATFPYPVYSQWAYKYNRLKGLKLNYQSIGSGGGIAQIQKRTVDFGASDAPLKRAELDQSGLVQFPMVLGGVVPVLNLQNVKSGELKLTPQILSDIFLGNIKNWDDPKIRKMNEGVKLPKTDITVVHRADGSGTTWIFTNYLDKVSSEWHQKVGAEKAVSWPVGVGGKGNEGVAAYVKQIDGSIGYVEFAYALQNQMNVAKLQNKAGKFMLPTIDSFQAAAASADWGNAPGFYMVLTDQPGETAWPITGASFILIYKDQPNRKLIKEMLEFFDWCYRHGADIAKQLQYVPMPQNVVDLVNSMWKNEITSGGRPVWP